MNIDQAIGRAKREKNSDGVVVWGKQQIVYDKEILDKMTREFIRSIEQESFKVSPDSQNYHLSGE